MKVNLRQKLSPQLTLTPGLKQAIRLLHMSSLEIEQELTLAAEQNPFLDFDPSVDEEQIDPILEFSHRSSSTKLHKIDPDDLEEFSTLSQEESLLEYLMQQISVLKVPSDVQKVMFYLAGCVDEKGYLRETNEELLEGIRRLPLDTEDEDWDEVLTLALTRFKQLDPPGVGAQTLSECLLIQLASRTAIPSDVLQAAKDIATDYLEDLGKPISIRLNKNSSSRIQP